jgi:hypothetical protein
MSSTPFTKPELFIGETVSFFLVPICAEVHKPIFRVVLEKVKPPGLKVVKDRGV